MRKSLLAHIAGDFISQYENVANSSVCYFLNEYPAARDALKIILGMGSVPTWYKTEESTASGGRPDVTGVDSENNKTVIIEGKFWANLTENQPNGYLNELDKSGRLLFLAPGKRKKSLGLELKTRLDDKDIGRLLVWSWDDFLIAVEKENSKNYDADLNSDLIQLRALCQRMDVEGMPPLTKYDLDPMNGRISAQLADVIDECNGVLREWKHADFSGLQRTPTRHGHGFYFRGYGFGCYLYFSSHDWYTKDNHTPIWMSVKKDSGVFKASQNINHALRNFDRVNAYDENLGIVLIPGMDREQVVQHIVNRVKEVLEYLNSNVVR